MICNECGKEHTSDDIELVFLHPDLVAALPTEIRAAEVQESSDLCILNAERFFIRATLPLPVLQRDEPYSVGVWVELRQPDFERIYELWDDPDQSSEPPFAVSLANAIPTLGDTNGLHAQLRLTGPTTRPQVVLMPSDHALAVEQTFGISIHRAHEYSALASG
ncbi:DUF2199 domain-containing protein [Pseudomonas sp. NPDC008258]|uniref:DUF2199 domain-containing protein n=1 Tax=Pseudomonas sp. NPDC008258 TaxID=3364418 RepID=UPI0036E841EB